ncbi:MAG: hypothetical protein ACOYN0_09165 [Phycisphaerales bacterium]
MQRPAFIVSGDNVVSTAERLWLDVVVDLASIALAPRLGASVLSSPAQAEFTPVFAAEFEIDGGTRANRGSLVFDHASMRAVADAVLSGMAGLQGGGVLAKSDFGFVEFALLTVAEALAVELPAAGRFKLLRFVDAASELGKLAGSGGVPTAIQVWVSGRSSEIRVQLDSWQTDFAPFDTAIRPRRPGSLSVNAGLSLPALQLNPAEMAAAKAGDTLLIGAAGLLDSTGQYLVTDNGWRLCAVEVQADSPSHSLIRTGELRIVPHDGWVSKPGVIHPLVGEAVLHELDLESWEVDQRMGIPKPGPSPIRLFSQGRLVGRGVLVLVGDELGVQLTEWSPGAPR